MPVVIEKEQLDKVNTAKGEYAVKVYNNDHTPFSRVVGVFIISCGYTEQVARKYVFQIHTEGYSVCYWGNKERCQEVVDDFKKAGVRAEIVEPT
jgi:ATP-dependent Clp protease adapter protein ClpS